MKLRRALRAGGLVIVIAAMLAAVNLLPLQALSNVGPDAGEYGGANVMYTLSNTTKVRGATTMSVPVYFQSKPGNVTVSIVYGGGPAQVQFFNGAVWSGNNPGNFTIPAAAFTYDTLSGYWHVNIAARLSSLVVNDNNYRDFRLILPFPGIIGYSSNNSDQQFAIANEGRCDPAPGTQVGCNRYFNYALPFAPACNVGSGVASFSIFDADNTGTGGQFNIQPKRFTVQLRDATTGGVQTFDNVTNMGDNQTAVFFFNFAQAHKYQLLLGGVYANNVLQFHLPFDSIYASIGCTYGLTPAASGAPATATPGAVINWNYTVSNSGAVYSTNPTFWAVIQVVYPPNFAGSPPGQHDNAGCGDYGGSSSCGALQATSNSGFPPGGSAVPANGGATSFTIPADAQAGSRYCRLLAVDPAAVDGNGNFSARNRWSAPSCVTVAKYPLVYFNDGDIWSSGEIYTAAFNDGSADFGSKVAYAGYAQSTVQGFGSANIPRPTPIANNGYQLLIFANTPALGNSALPHSQTSFPGVGTPLPSPGTINIASLASGDYYYSGNLVVNGGVLKSQVRVHATGTITIASSITSDPTKVNSLGALPYALLQSDGDVTINDIVTQIDATIVAGGNGTLYTCNVKPVNGSQCNQKLYINGPVVAKSLQLRRTSADLNPGDPNNQAAEYFNFVPSAILVPYTSGSGGAQVVTASETELPPRY